MSLDKGQFQKDIGSISEWKTFSFVHSQPFYKYAKPSFSYLPNFLENITIYLNWLD